MTDPAPKLNRRLNIIFASAVIISLAVSIGGLWLQAFLHQQALQQTQRISVAREATLSLNVALLAVHRYNSALIELAYHHKAIEPLTVVAYTEAIQAARQAFAELDALKADIPSLTPHTQAIAQLVNDYQTTLAQITAQIEQRRRIDGIEYQLREARRALWQILGQSESTLRERGLRIFLEEQAYLTTRRQEYIDSVRIQINQLRAAAAGLPQPERALLQQRMTDYLNAFLVLASLDRELEQYAILLQYHTDDMLRAIDGVQQVIAAEHDRAAATLNVATWANSGVMIWMIASSAAIFGALAWLFKRNITRPIEALTYAAKRVASGLRETPIPIIGADEIGDLARAIARLTAELNETIAKLEERVAQRTFQLQRTLAQNEALLAQERRRSRGEQVLIDLSLALSNLNDEAAIYRCVVDTLATGKEPDDRIGIYTRAPDSPFWEPQATHGFRNNLLVKLTIPPDLEQTHVSPCYVPDLSTHPLPNLPNLHGSAIVAAIQSQQQTHALLVLYRPQTNAFSEDEIAYVGMAARLAGQALTRVRLVTSLRQAKEAAETINRERSAFLARLDHDVRNPLNTIVIKSELLREALTDRPVAADDASTIARAGQRLLNRLNILLDSAKIESGLLTLQPEPFSLDNLLDNVLNELAPLLHHHHNRIEVDRPPQLGLIVADLKRLHQILLYTLRFVAATTNHSTITVQARRQTDAGQGDYFTVTISDTGETLSAAHIQALLTPFALPPVEARRTAEGQGLALSRQLCELMGGALQIHPHDPHGITVTIRIPIGVSPEPLEPVALPPRLPQPDIVVITATEARTLQIALERVGWQVQREASLAEATIRLHRPPAVLLIDLPADRAPVETLLRSAGWDGIPVIWLSHQDTCDQGITCAQWPGDLDTVIQLVQAVLPRPQPATGTILVIEDEEPTRLTIQRMLESEGWRVIEASDGASGEAIWRQVKPALVILDLRLPDDDGLAVLQRVRTAMSTPVIVVTAKLLHHDEIQALNRAGAVVLQKGRYRRSDLLAAVRTLAR